MISTCMCKCKCEDVYYIYIVYLLFICLTVDAFASFNIAPVSVFVRQGGFLIR